LEETVNKMTSKKRCNRVREKKIWKEIKEILCKLLQLKQFEVSIDTVLDRSEIQWKKHGQAKPGSCWSSGEPTRLSVTHGEKIDMFQRPLFSHARIVKFCSHCTPLKTHI